MKNEEKAQRIMERINETYMIPTYMEARVKREIEAALASIAIEERLEEKGA